MLDFERLIYELLTRGLDGDATVTPELDVKSLAKLPLVTYYVGGGNAVDGSSSPPTAWDVTLNLSVFDDDAENVAALARRLYDIVWGWDNQWNGTGLIDGLGHATEIDDDSVFSRVNAVEIGARSITQLSGSFSLQVHKA